LLAACGKADPKEIAGSTKDARTIVLLTAQSFNAIIHSDSRAKNGNSSLVKPTILPGGCRGFPNLAAPTQKPAVVNNNNGQTVPLWPVKQVQMEPPKPPGNPSTKPPPPPTSPMADNEYRHCNLVIVYKLVIVEGVQMGASGTDYRMPIPVDRGKIIFFPV
jgi:hypothetical protein